MREIAFYKNHLDYPINHKTAFSIKETLRYESYAN